MAKGQRFVCCCDSVIWCCVIHWFQWIVGGLGAISGLIGLAIHKFVMEEYTKEYDKTQLDSEGKEKPTPSDFSYGYLIMVSNWLVRGCMEVGRGTLLYCGIQRKSSGMLKAYVVIAIVTFGILIGVGTAQMIFTKNHQSVRIFVTGTIIDVLISFFVVWVVEVTRRDICAENRLGGAPMRNEYAVTTPNSNAGLLQSPSATAANTANQTSPAPVPTDDPAS